MSKPFRSLEHEIIYNKLKEVLEAKNNDEVTSIASSTLSESKHDYIKEISSYIKILEQTRENPAFRFLSSHRKWIGSIIVFGKKVVRKLLKWYIEPITIQQTEFNNAVTPSVGRLTELVSSLIDKTSQLNNKIEMNEANYKLELEQRDIQINELNAYMSTQFNQHEMVKNELERSNANLTKKYTELVEKMTFFKDHLDNVKSITKSIEETGILGENSESFYEKTTYAQSGEDSIIAYVLRVLGLSIEEVTYIDLGANHAKELSNTYYLYNKGAKGVLVEANSDLIPELTFFRHRDVILNKCVAAESGHQSDFYILSGDGLSTTDEGSAKLFCNINGDLKIVETRTIETISYSDIVEQYLGMAPTVLSIDIEGKDYEVLQSIDFENKRPLIIITEMITYDTKLSHMTKDNKVKLFLDSKEYDEYAFTGINSIFLDRKYLRERKQ